MNLIYLISLNNRIILRENARRQNDGMVVASVNALRAE